MVNVNDKADVHQTILEISTATTAQVTQSVTLAAFVIEDSILTWDEFMNVSGATDSGQLGLRARNSKTWISYPGTLFQSPRAESNRPRRSDSAKEIKAS